MSPTPRIPGLRALFRLDRGVAGVEQEVDDELRFHMEMTVSELVAHGMTPEQASAEARERFGNARDVRARLTSIDRERVAAGRRKEWWDGLGHDIRYALRGLRRTPGFTAAVVVTLGLGIGANAAMFGVVDRLLFRPPALLEDAGSVNRVFFARTLDGKERFTTNTQYRRYEDVRDYTTSFDRAAAFWFSEAPIGERESTENRVIGTVSASYFSFFDAAPAAGRYFSTSEDSTGAESDVAVLSYGYWQSHYGGRQAAVGERLRIGARSFVIIGVAPPGLTSIEGRAAAVFVPVTTWGTTMGSNRQTYAKAYSLSWLEIIVHRKPGVSVERATADLTHAFTRSYAAQREISPGTAPAESVRPRAIAAPIRKQNGPSRSANAKVALWLSGVTLIVLLIACANVANLLLARSFARRREIAVRLALGIGRGRLVTQLMTESLLLGVMGGAAGLLVAHIGGALLKTMLLGDVEWTSAVIDRRTLFFTSVATLVVGVLAGLAPALQAGRHDLAATLKSGTREGTYQRSRVRTSLLVLQGALSVVLLVGAGLFVRSLQHARAVPLGWDPAHVMWMTLDMRSTTLTKPERTALRERLRLRAIDIAGVASATRAVAAPFYQSWDEGIFVRGIDSTSKLGSFQIQTGNPEYFKTMSTRIMRGRGIELSDQAGSAPVMIVSQSMARALWPNADAMGKCVRVRADTLPCREVVGIAEDIHSETLGEDPALQYYMPAEQFEPSAGGLFVRTAGVATEQAERVRKELQRIMPGDAYLDVHPMMEFLNAESKSWTLGASLFAIFGGLALLLATIGLYSVIAYSVAQRAHEIGVRVALGAQGRDVVRLVVTQGLSVAFVGLALGTLAALWAGRFVKPLLFNQSPYDPLVFGAVMFSLLAAALMASLVPAWRAVKVDPVTALRGD